MADKTIISDESEAKRVRFNGPDLGGAEATYFAHPDGSDANACTHLYFGADDKCCSPEFSNQLFEDERIMGWANPELHIRYQPLTLKPLSIELVHDGGGDAALEASRLVELQQCLAPVLNNSDTNLVRHRQRSVGAGVGRSESSSCEVNAPVVAEAVFMPPGVPLCAYESAGQRFRIYLSQPHEDHAAAAKGSEQGGDSSNGTASETTDPAVDAVAAARTRLLFHDRCQKIGLWFIDGAEALELNDARWEVLYLFKVGVSGDNGNDQAPCEALAGYVTVHTFKNPFAGSRSRVCQALILPPFQRQGHGRRLLREVQQLVLTRPHVTEVTVEDPAPGFVKLRDATDYELCARLNVFRDANTSNSVGTVGIDMSSLAALSTARLQELQKFTKLTTNQLQRCADATVLQQLLLSAEGSSQEESSIDVFKDFRLAVKRRLNTQHKSDLDALPDATARKAALAELWNEYEATLKAALVTANKHLMC